MDDNKYERFNLPNEDETDLLEIKEGFNEYLADNSKQNEVKKIKKVSSKKWRLAPLVAAVLVVLGSGCNKLTKNETDELIYEENTEIMMHDSDFEETNGLDFYGNDNVSNIELESQRIEQNKIDITEYSVEYGYITYQGKTFAIDLEQERILNDIIIDTIKENNINGYEASVTLGLSGPVSGQITFNDFMKPNTKNENTEVKVNPTIHGTESNFDGEISFIQGDEVVQINLVDGENKIVLPGTVVKGSDLNLYKIDELELHEPTSIQDQIEIEDRVVNWAAHSIYDELALTTTAVGILGAVVVKIIKKK